MHKSAVFQTFMSKYFFTPIWGGCFLFVLLAIPDNDMNFTESMVPMFVVSLFWMILLMIKLRRVEAHEEHFIIKTLFKGDIIIDYKDIEYVHDMILLKGYVGLKYKDLKTLKSVSILIMTQREFGFNFTKENKMVPFIREQCKKANPYYMAENEPKRWKAVALIAASLLPVNIWFLYYTQF